MVVDGGTILRWWYPGAFWWCPGGFGGAVVVAGALPVAGFGVGHWTAVHGVFFFWGLINKIGLGVGHYWFDLQCPVV